MSLTDTETETGHPLDHLFRAVQAVVDRIPWHSEAQHAEVMDSLRQGEAALKGDAINDTAPPVVRPAAELPPGAASPAAAVAAGAGVDYDKLAEAIVRAQAKQAAADAAKADQPEEEAAPPDPGWTPPSS